MTEENTIWQDLRACKKEKFDADRARFLADAQAADDGGWTKHTQWHWSRMVNGERLDYWPSRKKYQYRGKVKRGDVMRIVKQGTTITAHFYGLAEKKTQGSFSRRVGNQRRFHSPHWRASLDRSRGRYHRWHGFMVAQPTAKL